MYVVGEVETREQAPWAYDATNDLPKSHPWYPGLMGLDAFVTKNFTSGSPLAAGGFFDSGSGSNTPQVTVPAGKTLFVTDINLFSAAAKIQLEMRADAGTTGVFINTPVGGGFVHYKPTLPLKYTAGQKMSFQLFSLDTVPSAQLTARVAYVLL